MKKKIINFFKKNYIVVSIVLGLILVIISTIIIVKIINNSNKVELKSVHEKVYQYDLLKKNTYEALITYENDNIIDIKNNGSEIDEDSIIYSEALSKIILPKKMIIYFYNKNNESYSLPKYTVIEDNSSLFNIRFNDKDILKNNFFLYDNEDTYVVFEPCILKYNGNEVSLSKFSYIYVNSNYIMYYDYANNKFYYEDTKITGASLYLNDYIIDLINDASVKNKNVNLLNRNIDTLSILKED